MKPADKTQLLSLRLIGRQAGLHFSKGNMSQVFGVRVCLYRRLRNNVSGSFISRKRAQNKYRPEQTTDSKLQCCTWMITQSFIISIRDQKFHSELERQG